MSNRSPEREDALRRLGRALNLVGQAVAGESDEARVEIFDTEDKPVNYLAALLFSDQGVNEAITNSRDPIIQFPEATGAEHVPGYIGAMVIVSTAMQNIVEGRVDQIDLLATPGATFDQLIDTYVTRLAEKTLPQ